MLIWIITTGEPFPEIDGKDVRLWRSILLTNQLLDKGHEVVRWSAAFDHTKKIQRFQDHQTIKISKNYHIEFIKTPGYTKNISLKRIYDHIVTAKKFSQIAKRKRKPDIILCSLPTVELCVAATNYGTRNHIPVVLDARDLWPDIFLDALPSRLRFLGKIALYPMYYSVKKACKEAYALTGISEPYIDWEINYAQRKKTILDRAFTHGYPETIPSREAIRDANLFWASYQLEKRFPVCLFSAMGNVLDLTTVFAAAKILQERKIPIVFVLCGDGVRLSSFKEEAVGLANVYFPGWVDYPKIWTLMRKSKIGLYPYHDLENYRKNIPNKPVEYLSAGLPIISSVTGLIKNMIEVELCGNCYENNKPDQLVQILISLYENPKDLDVMSNNATKLFNRQFAASKVYGEMAAYLTEVAEKYNQELRYPIKEKA